MIEETRKEMRRKNNKIKGQNRKAEEEEEEACMQTLDTFIVHRGLSLVPFWWVVSE